MRARFSLCTLPIALRSFGLRGGSRASISTAEDVTQECFLVLLKGAAFQGGSLRAYLFGITRHLARKRVKLADREADEVEDAEGADDPLENLLSLERSESVGRAVSALPALQREAL